MQISKLKLSKVNKENMFVTFYQALADFKSTKEVKTFLDDFLTEIERTTLAKRLMIALFLEKGKSYEFIKDNLKVSSATIANVDKMMTTGSHGFSLALKKIEADEWASKTAKKIASLFKKK